MLTQFLWNVVLQVGVHEDLEALIVNGLKGNREGGDVSWILGKLTPHHMRESMWWRFHFKLLSCDWFRHLDEVNVWFKIITVKKKTISNTDSKMSFELRCRTTSCPGSIWTIEPNPTNAPMYRGLLPCDRGWWVRGLGHVSGQDVHAVCPHRHHTACREHWAYLVQNILHLFSSGEQQEGGRSG